MWFVGDWVKVRHDWCGLEAGAGYGMVIGLQLFVTEAVFDSSCILIPRVYSQA